MKKFLSILALLLTWAIFTPAQEQPQYTGTGSSVTPFAGVPSGSCSSTQLAVNTTNGNLYSCSGGTWSAVTGSASSMAFSGLTSATNTAAAMVVGSGASLDYSGTGTLDANELLANALPTLATGFLNWTGSAWAFSTGGACSNALTMNNSGTGAASGATFNCSAAVTLSYNTLGAAASNAATTVNGQTCTLGSTCTIPEQVNSTNLTSQAGFNLLTSTANSVGLTVTPTNSATNQLKFEITGGSYTGNAATASNLSGCTGTAAGDICIYSGSAWARIAGNASGTQFLQETSSGVASWATPSGSGNTTSTSLTTNTIPKANGANSIINSSVSDNGTTVSTAEPISTAGVTTTGSNAGFLSLTQGSDNCVSNQPANSYCFEAPSSIGTAYHLVLPGTPSTGIPHYTYSAPTITETISSIANGDLANSTITIAGTSVALGSSTSSFPSPGAIGGTTPAAGTFTTLQANTQINAGVAGTLAPIVMGNATSGLLTLEPATGAITSYTIQFPVAQPTSGNTFLSCTAASPAVCTWAAGGGGSPTLNSILAATATNTIQNTSYQQTWEWNAIATATYGMEFLETTVTSSGTPNLVGIVLPSTSTHTRALYVQCSVQFSTNDCLDVNTSGGQTLFSVNNNWDVFVNNNILSGNGIIRSSNANDMKLETSGSTVVAQFPTSATTAQTNAQGIEVVIANNGTTATVVNELAILTGAPSTATVATTSSTTGVVGIVVGGAGTTGSASIMAHKGDVANCVFDATAITAGDYVVASTTTGGTCHDATSTRPSSNEVIGRALASGSASTTQPVLLTLDGE